MNSELYVALSLATERENEMAACIYCKWHGLALDEHGYGEEPTFVTLADCYCGAKHTTEHQECCSVFDVAERDDCQYFEKGE